MSQIQDKARTFDAADNDLQTAKSNLVIVQKQLSDAEQLVLDSQKKRDAALADLQNAVKGVA